MNTDLNKLLSELRQSEKNVLKYLEVAQESEKNVALRLEETKRYKQALSEELKEVRSLIQLLEKLVPDSETPATEIQAPAPTKNSPRGFLFFLTAVLGGFLLHLLVNR